MTRVAVVLLNLGGPDSEAAIRPFLLNFFSDPNIIRAPAIVRFVVARLIAWKRSKKEAGISYGLLGGRSPLLENTQAQAASLEAELNQMSLGTQYKTFIAMRYWHPLSPETAAQVKTFLPDEIVLLPLYPQYSTTTTRSSLQVWKKAAALTGLTAPTSVVCCYPRNPGFVAASVRNIVAAYQEAQTQLKGQNLPPPRVLFSAHGLPEDIITDGDPYQWQCEESARDIAEKTGIDDLDWQICYQSRVGPKKWIGPSTDEALHQAARDGVPVIIYPHAFVSEHVETLVEIEQEYRHLASELKIPYFARVPTVSVMPEFIAGLARAVKERSGAANVAPDEEVRICPNRYQRCCMNEFKEV